MKYTIINIADEDVTAAHTRKKLSDAYELATKMVLEQHSEGITKKQILKELSKWGYFKGWNWSVYIVIIQSEK